MKSCHDGNGRGLGGLRVTDQTPWEMDTPVSDPDHDSHESGRENNEATLNGLCVPEGALWPLWSFGLLMVHRDSANVAASIGTAYATAPQTLTHQATGL